ncbi:MAG: hypothetical protein ACPGJE_09800, partial [Wenzhouxiangellaceae bacterium]
MRGAAARAGDDRVAFVKVASNNFRIAVVADAQVTSASRRRVLAEPSWILLRRTERRFDIVVVKDGAYHS